jgi:hypothetical protein
MAPLLDDTAQVAAPGRVVRVLELDLDGEPLAEVLARWAPRIRPADEVVVLLGDDQARGPAYALG